MDLSPLTAIFTQMRHALLDPSAPTAAETAGGTLMLLIPIGLTLLTVGLGLWFFTREAPRIAERALAELADEAVGLAEQGGEIGRLVGHVPVEEAGDSLGLGRPPPQVAAQRWVVVRPVRRRAAELGRGVVRGRAPPRGSAARSEVG